MVAVASNYCCYYYCTGSDWDSDSDSGSDQIYYSTVVCEIVSVVVCLSMAT